MSERTTRSVQAINTAPLVAAASSAVLAAHVLGKLAHLLGQAAFDSFRQSASGLEMPVSLRPACNIAPIKTPAKRLKVRDDVRLPDVEAVKLDAILNLASKPYVVEPAAIEPHIQALQTATTLADTRREAAALTAAVRASHDRVLVINLAVACREAAIEIGFPSVDIAERSGGVVHIVASEPSGRALVTEIGPGQAPQLATEVVGVSDRSCTTILDAFDKALAKRGVRLLGHRRRFTAGVPELEVAREFVRRKVARARPQQAEASKPAKAKQPQAREGTRTRLRQR